METAKATAEATVKVRTEVRTEIRTEAGAVPIAVKNTRERAKRRLSTVAPTTRVSKTTIPTMTNPSEPMSIRPLTDPSRPRHSAVRVQPRRLPQLLTRQSREKKRTQRSPLEYRLKG